MGARTLLVVGADAGREMSAVAAGTAPRKDYAEIAARLNADLIDRRYIKSHMATRVLERLVGVSATQALVAFRQRRRYDAIFCDGESVGILLGGLLRLARRRPRHGFIGHLLTTRLKSLLFWLLRPQTGIDFIAVHSQRQLALSRKVIKSSRTQLILLPYQVDHTYWQPMTAVARRPTICSAGLEYRDYATFVRATDGLSIDVVIAASSRWSTHRSALTGVKLPDNVSVTSLDYLALRELYARSFCVVVPLLSVDNQAGVTTVLEAMAMGKPVIVTASPGQRDVIRGQVWHAGGPTDEVLGGPEAFGVSDEIARLETGLYVPPGDSEALRAAIEYFMANPDRAAALGAAGRVVAERLMSLDRFAETFAALIVGENGQHQQSSPRMVRDSVAGTAPAVGQPW